MGRDIARASAVPRDTVDRRDALGVCMQDLVYEVQACRGLREGCRFALWGDHAVVAALEQVLAASAWVRRADTVRDGRPVGHRAMLRVALAACPNACSMPQIRDVGIIAMRMPRSIRPTCDACGTCERLCRERAVGVSDARAGLHHERCVGCGACIAACPCEAIESEGVRLRILVGGRMGRHPRWAEQLCVVNREAVIGALGLSLDYLACKARGPERPADVVERVGMEALRRQVLDALSKYSFQDQRE